VRKISQISKSTITRLPQKHQAVALAFLQPRPATKTKSLSWIIICQYCTYRVNRIRCLHFNHLFFFVQTVNVCASCAEGLKFKFWASQS